MKKQYIEPEFEFYSIDFPGVLDDAVIHASRENGGETLFLYSEYNYDTAFTDSDFTDRDW